MRRKRAPNPPELRHFLASPDRNADVLWHLGHRSQQNVMLLKVFDYFWRGQTTFQHDKVGLGIDPANHPKVRLIEESLPIIRGSFRT